MQFDDAQVRLHVSPYVGPRVGPAHSAYVGHVVPKQQSIAYTTAESGSTRDSNNIPVSTNLTFVAFLLSVAFTSTNPQNGDVQSQGFS